MRLLAIETATSATACAVGDDDGVIEDVAEAAGRHTEVLAPSIAGLLAKRGWTAHELDGVVVDVGPGLFTGLRVGIATAKGLAVATGVGLFAVTSTDVLAQTASDAGVTGLVAAIVDARRGEVFWSLYDLGRDACNELVAVGLIAPALLVRELDALDGPVSLVGDGAQAHRDTIGGPGRQVLTEVATPSAGAAIRLVRSRVATGATSSTHDAVHPWYLREADAVANFHVRGPAA